MVNNTFKEERNVTTGFIVRTLTLVLLLNTLALAKEFIMYENAIQTPKSEQYSVNIKNITLYDFLDLISKMSHRVIVLEHALPELTITENPKGAVTLKELVTIANVYLKQVGLKMLRKENVYYVRSLNSNTLLNSAELSYISPEKATDSMELYNTTTTVGLQVTSVIQGGTYMQMGFRQHDIIIGVNKKRFKHISKIEPDFTHALKSDQVLCLEVLRDNTTIELCY